MSRCEKFFKQLARRKTVGDAMKTPLNRCLGIPDLIFLGIGNMVGTGIFVLTGSVAKNQAGPATVISYGISAVVATLAAINYAELGARVPLAGSGYTYTYYAVGEFCAFIVGWNMLLDYFIGTASCAVAWSGALDSLTNGTIRTWVGTHVGTFNSDVMGPTPDFVAFLAVAVVTGIVCIGARTSSRFNIVMVIIKLLTIGIIAVAGCTVLNLDNWTNEERGGFAPFGMIGILSGSATCFYAYIGFDAIAVAGEETGNPRRAIPIATGLAIGIATFLYIFTSAVLTLMMPYDEIDPTDPYPGAFEYNHIMWAKYVVAVGTLFGLSTVILGSMFSLPRITYAMATDGLLFGCFAYVQPWTQTPIIPIILFGFLAGACAFFLNLSVLVELLSIGTLICFTFVAVSVIVLRYRLEPVTSPTPTVSMVDVSKDEDSDVTDSKTLLSSKSDSSKATKSRLREIVAPVRERVRERLVTYTQDAIVTVVMAVLSCSMIMMLLLIRFAGVGHWWSICLIVLLCFPILACLCTLACLDQAPPLDTFQVSTDATYFSTSAVAGDDVPSSNTLSDSVERVPSSNTLSDSVE